MSTIDGTDGDDRIIGTDGADVLSGGAGRDRLNGGQGDDIVSGGDDNDYVYGDEGNDTLYGGQGNDALVGHSGDDLIYGEEGNDGVFGGGGHDTIFGGAGTDTLFGDGGNDVIDGGAGDDKLYGGSGNDTLVYTVGEGADMLDGGAGYDTARFIMTADDLDASRAEFSDFAEWILAQAEGGGGSFTFASSGVSVTGIENAEFIVDGAEILIDELLNQAPVAASEQSLATVEDAGVAGSIGATDPDGDELNYVVSAGPTNGTVLLDPETGEFTYNPVADFSGSDSFTVQIDDGRGEMVEQVINVTVDAMADAPTLAASVGDVVGDEISGSDGFDYIVGTRGDDTISGGSGSDFIFGGSYASDGITIGLNISAGSQDIDGSESVLVKIDGVPEDGSLSAGTNLGNGSWQLAEGDLDGLTLTLETLNDVTLRVTATATEANGSTQSVSQDLLVQMPVDDGNDTINGGSGNDYIFGGSGDDVIEGGTGSDYIDGGSGIDTVSYAEASGGIDVDLDKGRSSGADGSDRLTNVENVIGSSYNDDLTGDDGVNVIQAGAGDDVIRSGRGSDILTGGSGSDRFEFTRGDVASGKTQFGFDTITDFSDGDRLDFSDLLKGMKYSDISDVIQVTETSEGTMLSVDSRGYSGFADVVFLEGVFDLDLDYLDGSGQLIV